MLYSLLTSSSQLFHFGSSVIAHLLQARSPHVPTSARSLRHSLKPDICRAASFFLKQSGIQSPDAKGQLLQHCLCTVAYNHHIEGCVCWIEKIYQTSLILTLLCTKCYALKAVLWTWLLSRLLPSMV